jgi:hypothetical protein
MKKSEPFIPLFKKEVGENKSDDDCREADGDEEKLVLSMRRERGSGHHAY